MNANHTPSDVERLVKIAQYLQQLLDDVTNHDKNVLPLGLSPGGYTRTELKEAIDPFLPNPEEELIEKMAREMMEYSHPTWKWGSHTLSDVRNEYLGKARAALAVFKQSPFWKEPGNAS